MAKRPSISTAVLVVALALGGIWYATSQRATPSASATTEPTTIAVELAPIEQGVIRDRRTFSGTLEANAQFIVAPKVSGRLTSITVDLADTVRKGQIVAELDDEEYRQAVAEARAELAVARAEVQAAHNARDVAKRSLERVSSLHTQGVASEQELDAVTASHLEAQAAVQVATAHVQRATAALQAASVRADYTKVRAEWPGDDQERTVAERFADEGQMLAANTQLLSIVDLDPVIVVVYAPQADYAVLAADQAVQVTTDAYPGTVFEGRVNRIAPVFRAESRQARVELQVDNADHRLRPGMFVRAETIIGEVSDATFVPQQAVVTRDGRDVVFVTCQDAHHACIRPVETGVRDGNNIQIKGDDLTGQVVVVGQHQLDDGAPIRVPHAPAAAGGSAALSAAAEAKGDA